MGFRIDKGIFQFKDGDRFINKFKIDADGTMVEVDPESGDPVAAYMRTGDQAADADTVDGIHAGGFIRSDATDNVTGHTEWQDGYNIRLGNSADFRMWHDGSHTYFRNYNHGNGNIYFQGEDTAGANHALLYMFTANTRPYVSLYEDGGERFKTTSAGVEVLGEVRASNGIRLVSSGAYGLIRGYDNDNHFIVIRGSVSTGTSTLSITGGHRTTFVEHVNEASEGWYFVSKASGNYTEMARIDGVGQMYISNNKVWHAGNDGSGSGLDSDKLDGSHRHEIGNRDYSKQGFYVDGDPETYYPVLFSPRGGYAFNRWSISRRYSWTAPWDPIGTGSHKGGLTFDFYWTGDTAWGGNDKTIRIHQFAEQYTTMVGGIQLARTGGMIVWLRGGNAYYELQTDCGQVGIDPKYDTWTDGSGVTYSPTGDVNEYRNSIWANYPVRGNNDLYHNGDVVATESWVDSNFVKPSESVASATSATTARDLGSYYTADDWFRATGDDNHVKIYGNSRQMLFRTDGTTEAYSGVGGYPFVWTYNGSSSGNRIMILHTDGRLWTNRYGWLDTAFDAAGTGASQAAGVNTRIDDEIVPQITANATAIARNATDIAGKANAGGSYSQDFAADDMRVDQWFRNTVSGKGLYNDATTQHWYSDSDDYWNIAGGSNQNGIRFRDEHGGTIRGYILANNSNQIGFLDAGGSWALRHDNDSGTYFYTDGGTEEFKVGRDVVTGDYGTVQVSSNRGGWGGYSIYGQYVLMSNGSRIGIYNDIDNEWMIQCYRNAQVELRHNGAIKLETTSGGVSVTGTVTATSFSGSGAGLTNLPVVDQTIPVTINGEGNDRIVSINMNLDRGQIEFTLTNGQTFTAQMGR